MRQAAAADQRGGGSGKAIVAYLVLEEGRAAEQSKQQAAMEEVKAGLRRRLPDDMMPSSYVLLDSLPMTPNGKLDRKSLPEPEQQPQREGRSRATTPVEEIIGGIFCQVLGVREVGAEEDFFELGGHSLLATRVVARVRQVFSVELSVRQMFETPSVRGLSQVVEQQMRLGVAGGRMEKIERVSRDEPLGLSSSQQRLWFLHQLDRSSPFYNLAGAVRLKGRVNVAALGEAFRQVVRRHEALRTRFIEVGGEARQLISPTQEMSLSLI